VNDGQERTRRGRSQDSTEHCACSNRTEETLGMLRKIERVDATVVLRLVAANIPLNT